MTALILISALIVLFLLSGMPAAVALGGSAFIAALLLDRSIDFFIPTAFWQTGGFALLALPLFILTGSVMRDSSLSHRLTDFVDVLVGRVRGGLGTVTVLSCALFGAISGSGASAIAAIGPIMIPRMEASGYSRAYASSLVSCAAVLALLIPPSIPMIVFAQVSGIPVTACFLATVGPAVIIIVIYMFLNRIDAEKLPGKEVDAKNYEGRQAIKPSTKIKRAGLTLGLPVIVLCGIYSGIFTPTEAAAVGFGYAFVISALIYRDLSLRRFVASVASAAMMTGTIILILFSLLMLSRLMVLEQVPMQVGQSLLAMSGSQVGGLLLMNLFLLVMGMLIDDISGSILAAIVLYPVATKLGLHPVHFAAIVGTNIGFGNMTPPCAPMTFIGAAVGNVPILEMMKPTLRLLAIAHLPALVLVTFWPDLSLWLPRLLLGIG